MAVNGSLVFCKQACPLTYRIFRVIRRNFFIFKTTFKGWCDLCFGATFLWFSTQRRTAEKSLEWPLPSVT